MKNSKAIICVDDELIILDSLTEQLSKKFGNSYIYETAENAEEGMELIEELIKEGIKIFLIISDWLMPGMKGDEFLIKVHEMYPNIIKVLLTGQAKKDAIDKAIAEAKLFDVIHKPWSDNELFDTINSAILKND